jgi:hypothetical protein
LAFKSGGFALQVLHFLKMQATTEKDEGQVSELPISISPRKKHCLAAVRPFGRPPPGPLSGPFGLQECWCRMGGVAFSEKTGYGRKRRGTIERIAD